MKGSASWMYIILPISAISEGISIAVPLLVLLFKGTVYDVGVATALFALVEIPASIFWGNLTDRLKKTKLFILLSVVGFFPILLILYFINSVPSVYAVYGVYAFIATASSPAINILIMSGVKNRILPKYFSRYSVLVIIGSLFGLVPGIFINGVLIKPYLISLLVANVIALAAAMFLLSSDKPAETAKNKNTVKRSFGLLNMLSVTPHILTGHKLLEIIHRDLKSRKKKDLYMLLMTISLFNFGSYLFNTAYIPYLYNYSVSYSGIFSINLSNVVAQLVIYVIVMSIIRNFRLEHFYRLSTVIRSASYTIALLPIFAFTRYIFGINIAAFFIAGIAYAMWNISASVMVYEKIRKMQRGHYIGLWIAIVGLSGVIGAFIAGVMSTLEGYASTFILGITFIILSLFVFEYSERVESKESTSCNI